VQNIDLARMGLILLEEQKRLWREGGEGARDREEEEITG